MAPFTVDTAAGNDPTQDLDGNATPRTKSITRLRTFTSVLCSPSLQQPLRQEKAELDSQTTPAQTANGGVAVSTRDTVAFGFGLEQVDQSTREALVAKAFGYLLPATADTTAPVAEFTYPLELKEVNAVDPVDLEVKAYDERGDIKEVRLYANDSLVTAKRSFPFQFRYYVPANAAANSVITFKAEAEDKAGNVKTITRQVRVVSAAAIAQTPIAVGLAGADRHADRRLDADADQHRVHQHAHDHPVRVVSRRRRDRGCRSRDLRAGRGRPRPLHHRARLRR